MNSTSDLLPLLIFGVPFHRVTLTETVQRCIGLTHGDEPGFVATPNLDFVMQAQQDPELYRILARANLVIADGMPIVWLAKFLGPELPERVAGSDLVIHLAEAAAKEHKSVFHLGGAPGVPEKAGAVLQSRFPGLQIAGAFSPPKTSLLEMDHEAILSRLRESKPDILYVAFGAPKQEKWINMHLQQWEVKVSLGIGGSLDFLAGAQKRAPQWMQKAGLEWIWRLGTDPKRLWKRYGANLMFLSLALLKVWRIRLSNAAAPPAIEAAPYWEACHHRWTGVQDDHGAQALLNQWAGTPPIQPLWLDMEACPWLDSRELGLLLTTGHRYREAGVPFLISGCSKRLTTWLTFNGLHRLITFVTTAEELEQARPMPHVPTVEHQNGILFCTLPKELTAATQDAWKQEILSAWDKTPPVQQLVLEAELLEFLDSAGLGALIGLRKRAADEEIPFRLTHLQGAALTTVRIARVEKVLGLNS